MSDLQGKRLYRELTYTEQLQSRLMVDGQELRKAPRGGFVGSLGQGDVTLLAMPVDTERVVSYVRTKVNCRCKADKMMWRLMHPIPMGPVEDEPEPTGPLE